MTDFYTYINSILKQNVDTDSTYETRLKVVQFLEDNHWFGIVPELIDNKLYISEEEMELLKDPLIKFISTNDNPIEQLKTQFEEIFPDTASKLQVFFDEIKAPEETQFYLIDFLAYNLKKNIILMSDEEVSEIVEEATSSLIKIHGDILTFFLSWLKSKCRTRYKNEYIMEHRISMEGKNGAYDVDEYLELLYYLFNENYIEENEMYQKAAKSKNYADTWLFLAMHFICAIRYTDMARIYHPILPYEPDRVLNDIENGTFSDKDAELTLASITLRLCVLPMTPNKTERISNVSSVKITFPTSCQIHFGTLFALCEAHRQIQNIPDSEPLIRKITDYDRISRYMGDEIGGLFLDADFRSRSANKSYLQSIYSLTDDILDAESESFGMKGYIFASMARSHKGSYGSFARTTEVYLKDAKMSGLSAEFVAMELFERGVLSFIPSMLLKMVTNGEYNVLSLDKQTTLIQQLNLSPNEIENSVALINKAHRNAEQVVQELISTTGDSDTIINILHSIGSGDAFSKQPECLCLLSALKKSCAYTDRQQCIGCQYEISTKSTLYLLISEYNRMYDLFQNASKPAEKKKYQQLISQVILPKLDEILQCIREQYGESVFETYENIIKENIR